MLWKHILEVRKQAPLVHNITNYVVMNNSANALLAIGASPIMAHAHSEVRDMVSICQSLVINIGTLDEYKTTSMKLAIETAIELEKPWILDPVGAGATPYRDQILAELLPYRPAVIRGNASEIMALAKTNTSPTKGVDSSNQSDEALEAARQLQQSFGSVVCISGETDIIVGAERTIRISNGHPLMTRVTGLGCSATAVIGAFIGVTEDKVEATAAATALFSIAGELAQQISTGPGSLQVNILDVLYNMTEQQFIDTLKIQN
ncbi:hydroxyethylthiazole kinase [Sphingobacterium spiritivorum]|uniref:Hydroxyethylthiazole kinase n=1 Tax=Sphingobacterium spiritivorum ATCC 33861 TaxID=525373 RepID=D7VQF5_SPHSI|nr:hydroxyethylthiazole kinase [Sphingobacterium spiritivorum]EFK56006.1 hydroxyethylthiazole kinase [Sphingobacterium spiritivorum ATCC 33861]QQT35861.1 hydroxyethylthiazole kinase [Sphingobacterium spiritivorum]WQD32588.1 hydroxyethylthiazole kinase [Sphingobacterium spiritivorum]SUJ11317.1 Hydroxyethylthiazole kinase [Sphingobacterium spiritivorum]